MHQFEFMTANKRMLPQHSTPPTLRRDYYTSCMHALDDVGWEYGFSFTAYGVEIGVRFSTPDLVPLIETRTPYATRPSNAVIVDRLFSVLVIINEDSRLNRYNLYWDHMLFGKELTLEEMLDIFNALSSLAIAELSDEKLFVHAGVVEWQGRAILIPGRSHSGKSSLVAELVKCGATYFSDEFAVIDMQGQVTAYPKPLSIRNPGEHMQKPVLVEEIGGKIGDSCLTAGLVVISQYSKNSEWMPQSLSPGVGLLSLLENTHSARRTPERALQTLGHVASNALFITSLRGEASVAAPKILRETTFW